MAAFKSTHKNHWLLILNVSNNHISRYNIHRVDYEKLWNLLSNINQNETIGDLSVLEAWDYFSSIFNGFLQETVPLTTVKLKNNNIYITHEAKSLKSKRNCLWKKYTTPHSDSDYAAYTTTRNALCSLTCKLCRNFKCGIANNIRHNPKAFWSHVKSRVKTCANIEVWKVLMVSFIILIVPKLMLLMTSSLVCLLMKILMLYQLLLEVEMTFPSCLVLKLPQLLCLTNYTLLNMTNLLDLMDNLL